MKGCSVAALLLSGLVAITGDLMGSSDRQNGNLVIYYLSPQVLTRTRMTPQRLKQEAFRLKTDDSSPSGAEELIQGVYAAEHKITGSKVSQYDFRLCIASNTESMWFSSDGKVGFINGDPFELSSNERVKVRKLFGELDALVYAGKKAR